MLVLVMMEEAERQDRRAAAGEDALARGIDGWHLRAGAAEEQRRAEERGERLCVSQEQQQRHRNTPSKRTERSEQALRASMKRSMRFGNTWQIFTSRCCRKTTRQGRLCGV